MNRRAPTKPCAKCGTLERRRGQSYCAACHCEMVTASYRKKRAWIDAWKLARGCLYCGYDHCASALHLHHRDPETKNPRLRVQHKEMFPRTAMSRMSFDDIKHEVTLCDVLCANCHAETHHA